MAMCTYAHSHAHAPGYPHARTYAHACTHRPIIILIAIARRLNVTLYAQCPFCLHLATKNMFFVRSSLSSRPTGMVSQTVTEIRRTLENLTTKLEETEEKQ